MIKRSIHKEGITLNIYVPNNSLKIHEARVGRPARRNRTNLQLYLEILIPFSQ